MKKLIGVVAVVIILVGGIVCYNKYQLQNTLDHYTMKQDSGEINKDSFEIIYTPQLFQWVEMIQVIDDNPSKTVYSYKGDVAISLGGEIKSLTQALDEGDISIAVILEQAKADSEAGKIESENYKDGGSQLYQYPTYSVLKLNKIEGNQDIYIGGPDMDINGFILDRHIGSYKVDK